MLRPILELLRTEVSGENSLDHVLMITRHHRIQASPGYRAAANDVLRVLARSGVAASLTTYPADGKRREWTHLTPQEWECRDAELWLTNADGQRLERLAWYQELNLAIIQRSCATAPEGVAGELVVVDRATEAASWQGVDAAGKIALVGNGDIHQMWRHATAAGAVGLVTARMTYSPPVRPEGDLPDALQYTSFWWSEGEPQGWGFVLSTRQGERLRRMAAAGPVRLWARVNAAFADGTIENVEAVISGETDEEVLVVSHLCHPKPSANDNATGPATVMETARALHRLVAEGRLPRPKRTIRFLMPPEMTGTYAHLAARTAAERSKVVAGLNVDMVGQNQAVTGSVLLCEYPPLACPSFAGDLLALVLSEVAAEVNSLSGFGTRYGLFRHAVTGFSGGSDHYILSDPTVGIPSPMIIQWPDRFYHTSADTPDRCDPAMLKRVAVMTGAYAWFLANAGLAEATWLAAEMAALFPRQLHEALAGAADPGAVAGFRTDRKLADVDALQRLVPADQRADWQQVWAAVGRQVRAVAEMEMQRVALVGGASEAPAASTATVVTGWLGDADLTVVRPARVHPGPISLRNYLPGLPEADSWRAFSAAHAGGEHLEDYLCYWADGQRSLAEICRLTALETGQRDDALALGYFQLLAKLGLATGV